MRLQWVYHASKRALEQMNVTRMCTQSMLTIWLFLCLRQLRSYQRNQFQPKLLRFGAQSFPLTDLSHWKTCCITYGAWVYLCFLLMIQELSMVLAGEWKGV